MTRPNPRPKPASAECRTGRSPMNPAEVEAMADRLWQDSRGRWALIDTSQIANDFHRQAVLNAAAEQRGRLMKR